MRRTDISTISPFSFRIMVSLSIISSLIYSPRIWFCSFPHISSTYFLLELFLLVSWFFCCCWDCCYCEWNLFFFFIQKWTRGAIGSLPPLSAVRLYGSSVLWEHSTRTSIIRTWRKMATESHQAKGHSISPLFSSRWLLRRRSRSSAVPAFPVAGPAR